MKNNKSSNISKKIFGLPIEIIEVPDIWGLGKESSTTI